MRKEGYNFSFDPKACESCSGRCCIGDSGYIWVTPKEINDMSVRFNLKREDFITEYLSKIGYRYTIKELPYLDGYKCVFFDIYKKQCKVYDERPTQCRTFPFWEHFKNNISEVEEECPGIYRL